jgi:hypothetical protein
MTPASVLLAIQLLEALPGMITASEEVIKLIADTVTKLKAVQAGAPDLTPDEVAALKARIAGLTAKLAAAR